MKMKLKRNIVSLFQSVMRPCIKKKDKVGTFSVFFSALLDGRTGVLVLRRSVVPTKVSLIQND